MNETWEEYENLKWALSSSSQYSFNYKFQKFILFTILILDQQLKYKVIFQQNNPSYCNNFANTKQSLQLLSPSGIMLRAEEGLEEIKNTAR